MSYTPPRSPRTGEDLSSLYIIIGGAVLLSAGVVPLVLVFAYRYCGRHLSRGPEFRSEGVLEVGGNSREDEPNLFDLYVKTGLQVDETRFGDFLPMAVRTASTDPGDKAPTRGVSSKTYDVAVLIKMPNPHSPVKDNWDKLGECAIGTLKLPATITKSWKV